MKYRKKPVVIDAVRWDGDAETANSFLGENYSVDWEFSGAGTATLVIPTLAGKMLCNVGDYIIKGVQGEFYPCPAEIFEQTYETVEE